MEVMWVSFLMVVLLFVEKNQAKINKRINIGKYEIESNKNTANNTTS